jgi:hypothetical protein
MHFLFGYYLTPIFTGGGLSVEEPKERPPRGFLLWGLTKINPLTSNNLQRRRAVSLLKIKISSKNMREKPTNTPIIHSVY